MQEKHKGLRWQRSKLFLDKRQIHNLFNIETGHFVIFMIFQGQSSMR
jgi:hypothetical protein